MISVVVVFFFSLPNSRIPLVAGAAHMHVSLSTPYSTFNANELQKNNKIQILFKTKQTKKNGILVKRM